MKKSWGAPAIIVASLATLALTWGLLSDPMLGLLVLGVIAGFALLAWRPVEVLVFVLVISQEIKSSRDFWTDNQWLVFGNWLFFTKLGSLPLILVLVVAASALHLIKTRRSVRWDEFSIIWSALALWVVSIGALESSQNSLENAFFAGLLQMVPLLLLSLGYFLGKSSAERDTRSIFVAAAAGLFVNLIIAVVAAASGPLAPIDYGGIPFKLFHDTATAALFLTAVFFLLFERRKWTPGHLVLTVLFSAIVILCFRRSVWFAAIGTGAFLLLALGGRSSRRTFLIASFATLIGLLAFPSLLGEISRQASQVIEAIWNAPAEQTSAELHVSDLEVGWAAALASPLMGVGIFSSQVGGLAAGGSSLYVHNEFLQVWLRWGAPGLLLFAALLVVAVIAGYRVVVSRLAPSAVRAAGIFLILLPVPLMTAPFISMTSRWSTLVGISVGLALGWVQRDRLPRPALQDSFDLAGWTSSEQRSGRGGLRV